MVEKLNKDVLEFCCHSHFLLWRDSWKDSRKGIFVNEIYFQLSVSKSVGPSRSRLLTLMLWVWSSGDVTLRFKVLLSTYILNVSSSPISPVSWSFMGLVFFPPKGWTVMFPHIGLNNSSNLFFALSCLSKQLTAIFAFGSCGGFSGKNIVSVLCGDGSNQTLDAIFHYPFRWESRQSFVRQTRVRSRN